MDWKPHHPEQKSSNWSSLLQTVMDFLPVSSFRYSCYASDGCNGDLLCLCHHRYCHHLHLQVSQTCLYLCTEYENWTYDPIATPADLSLNHYTHAAHQAQKERLEGEILIWLQQRKPWFLYILSHWKWKWTKHKTDKKLTHALKFKNWLHTGRWDSTVTEVCYHQFISWSHSLALVWLLFHL